MNIVHGMFLTVLVILVFALVGTIEQGGDWAHVLFLAGALVLCYLAINLVEAIEDGRR